MLFHPSRPCAAAQKGTCLHMQEFLEELLGPMSEETGLVLEKAPEEVQILVAVIVVSGWQLDCAPVRGSARLQFSKDHWRQVSILRWRKLAGAPPRPPCDELPPLEAFPDTFLLGVAEVMCIFGFTIQRLIPPGASSFDGSLCLINPDGNLMLTLEAFQGKGR